MDAGSDASDATEITEDRPGNTATCWYDTNGGTPRVNPAASLGSACSPCPLDNLRVAVIGGFDRLEPRYRPAVESLGARFSSHNGDCHGKSEVLKNVVCRSDIVVFITRMNSHAALQAVRGICKKSGRKFTALRETSPRALKRVLQEVG